MQDSNAWSGFAEPTKAVGGAQENSDGENYRESEKAIV